jgi:fluoride ion exporter CrcB/FEX
VQANVVASGVTGTIAVESEALMQDFKTGYLIGGTPRHLTVMQLLAVPVGALVVSYMYPILRDQHGLNDSKTVVHEKIARSESGISDGPTAFVITDSEAAKKVEKGDSLILRKGAGAQNYAVLKVAAVEGNRVTVDPAIPAHLQGAEVRWRVERPVEAGLSSPISNKWSGFAKLLQDPSKLPKGALWAAFIGVALGIFFTALEQNKKIKPWTPSPTGIGIGMLVPFTTIFSMFLGGLVELVWRKADAKSAAQFVIPLASGLIAGDAIVNTIIPLIKAIQDAVQ